MQKTQTAPEGQVVESSPLKKPDWYLQYGESFLSGQSNVFILTGDIHGHAYTGKRNKVFLSYLLATTRDIVICYNRARGFSFPIDQERGNDNHRARAIALLPKPEEEESENSSVQNALLSALNGGKAKSQSDETYDPFEGPFEVLEALRFLERLMLAKMSAEEAEKATEDEQKARSSEGRMAILIEDAALICPHVEAKAMLPGPERDILATLFSWGQDKVLGDRNIPIFLLAADATELHADLRSSNAGTKIISIPLPDRDERLAHIQRYMKANPKYLLRDLTAQELANLTAGLNRRHLEDLFPLGYRGNPSGVSRALVSSFKQDVIKTEFTDVAELLDPLIGGFASLGGLRRFTKWAKTDLIAPLLDGSPDAPAGVLLVGPPGTGKTLVARAIAAEAGLNAISLLTEKILGQYVGNSERNLARFFALARAMAPVLIFVDEIDQGPLSQRGNDSGNPVASSLFNAVLQFMSDPSLKGRVVVIFASNRPDLLDDALLRPGRMDAIFPILLPDLEERVSILYSQVRSQGFEIAAEAVELAAAQSVDYSGADLGFVVAKAKVLSKRAGVSCIGVEEMTNALRFIRPKTPQIARRYTLLAVQACTDTEHLPEEWQDQFSNRDALKRELKKATEAAEEIDPFREETRTRDEGRTL